MIHRLNNSALWVRLNVSATAIWSAAASEARRRFGLRGSSCDGYGTNTSQSGVALRLPPHSIKSRSVTDSFNHTLLQLIYLTIYPDLDLRRTGGYRHGKRFSARPANPDLQRAISPS